MYIVYSADKTKQCCIYYVSLLLFFIFRRETFNHLESWLEVSGWQADSKRIITLLGNKCDRTDIRDVYTQEGK